MTRRDNRRSRNLHPGAFTAIELLVAIAILVILVGIVAFGLRTVVESSKDRATKQTLTNLKGMLAEFDLKGGLSRQPPAMWVNGNSYSPPAPPPPVSLNFWNDGDPTDNSAPTPPDPDPVPAVSVPHLVKRGDPDRSGSDAVLNTEIAMQMLIAIPLNRTALSGIPSNQQEKNTASRNVTDPRTMPMFPVGVPPLVLDGWGNPMIFVPAGGLRVTFASRNNAPAVVTSAGVYDPTNAGTPNPPIGVRPFFASAGPDGDFSKGDDNIYSFEQ